MTGYPGLSGVPEQIGRYRLRAELGRGSMGRVYLAHDPNIDRGVALKLLMPSFEVDPRQREEIQNRFLLEARAAGRLNHPGIVAVHDAAIDPASQLAYIAMELVEGVSLADLLEQRGRLAPVFSLEIVAQAARALHFAHEQGVVHRDVKPANIMVREDHRVKVLDFGIAKLITETHTVAGQVLGTPAYMSPEQLEGSPVDGRSDLFSLGAVLFQCLIGQVPFPADSVAGIALKIVSMDPEAPPEKARDVPDSLWNIVGCTLQKDPSERYQSLLELAEALDAARDSLPEDPPETEPIVVPPLDSRLSAKARDATELGAGAPLAPTLPALPAEEPVAGHTVIASVAPARSPTPGGRSRRTITVAVLALAVVLAALLIRRSLESSADEAFVAIPVAPPTRPLRPVDSEEVPAGRAKLELIFENRLKQGHLTVWIDQEPVWSQELVGSKRFFERAAGDTVTAFVTVLPGEHLVEVRVTGAKRKVDASARSTTSFDADETRRLKVSLLPFSKKLQLSWE